MIAKLKARINAWLVRDVKPLAEDAHRQHASAAEGLTAALEKFRAAEAQANTLQRMDKRNHYTQSLIESYNPLP